MLRVPLGPIPVRARLLFAVTRRDTGIARGPSHLPVSLSARADPLKAPVNHAKRLLIASVILNLLLTAGLIAWVVSLSVTTSLTYVDGKATIGNNFAVRQLSDLGCGPGSWCRWIEQGCSADAFAVVSPCRCKAV